MKGVKGKLMKKLKTMKTIGYLKPERILQVNALDGYFYTSPLKLNPASRTPLADVQEEIKNQLNNNVVPFLQEPEVIDVSDLMKDLDEEEEYEFDCEIDDKENVRPEIKARENTTGERQRRNEIFEGNKESGEITKKQHVPLSEIDVSSFRRPELNSKTLFDPNLLAAFQQAVKEVKAIEAERRSRNLNLIMTEDVSIPEPPLKARKLEKVTDPLLEFEEKCPPGGTGSVILYTTGLRGIRKTFDDCQKIRSLLENIKIVFFERDISMHSEYKRELFDVLGGKVAPPRLFIMGRYIGGTEDVMTLHEQGKFKPLVERIPIDKSEGPCEGCYGFRFIVCFNCNGSRKIVPEGTGEGLDCAECNENGIVVCPFCC